MKMTAKADKEITYMPLVTIFSILERPGKNRKGIATPPWVDEGFQDFQVLNTVTSLNLETDQDVDLEVA